MREFGSDFHYFAPIEGSGKTVYDFFPSANLYADGRQALIHLYQTQRWERLWVPAYFCYDVVESFKQAGLNICFYADSPEYHDNSQSLESLHRHGDFKPTDAILRVNYFGIRSFRDPRDLPVAAVIEDHTHDLIGGWVSNSQADWCIASLRKTLPIPEGGILWSPIGRYLPDGPINTAENELIAEIRWEAMRLKARYLEGEEIEKASFRSGYLDTESFFDRASVCSIDEKSRAFLHSFNIQDWYVRKRDNWRILHDIKRKGMHILEVEDSGCYPFSLVMVFDSRENRDRVRKSLIENQIYPAVLWDIPSPEESDISLFSHQMLSVHCDARYSKEDIVAMKSIIESIL